jgi:spore maturation protein CgeB
MRNLGHEADIFEEQESSKKIYYSQELIDVFLEYDLIFTVNYFPRVSDICEKIGKKYVSWTVDSPLIAMFHQSIFNECNYVFIFDKFSYVQFKQMGVKNVYYLPLAVNTKRIDELLENSPKAELDRFSADVSFVGGLYHKNSYDGIKDKLPEYLKGYFDAAMVAQLDWFGENIFDRMLTVDVLEQLSQIIDFQKDERSFSDLKLVFSTTFLGYKMAQFERITCLNKLATKCHVSLYTDKSNDELIGVDVIGSVNYENDMPKVFNRSKVNMNFTIRNIRSGIPLRVWDVLGAGGFLLTNFQAELPSLFENGKHIVYYESIDDMLNKAQYYLTHDEEREQIAKNGHALVSQYHSYEKRLEQILSIVQSV